MNLEKVEVIERFCALSSRVMREKFKFNEPADCFCEHSQPPLVQPPLATYEFSSHIIEFIEQAVDSALKGKHEKHH